MELEPNPDNPEAPIAYLSADEWRVLYRANSAVAEQAFLQGQTIEGDVWHLLLFGDGYNSDVGVELTDEFLDGQQLFLDEGRIYDRSQLGLDLAELLQAMAKQRDAWRRNST